MWKELPKINYIELWCVKVCEFVFIDFTFHIQVHLVCFIKHIYFTAILFVSRLTETGDWKAQPPYEQFSLESP